MNIQEQIKVKCNTKTKLVFCCKLFYNKSTPIEKKRVKKLEQKINAKTTHILILKG